MNTACKEDSLNDVQDTPLINPLQEKLIEYCIRKKLSVDQIYENLKIQRDLSRKMIKHADEALCRKVFKKSVMVTCNYGGSQRTSKSDVLYQLREMDSKFILECTPSELNLYTNMVFWSMESGVPSSMAFLSYFRKLLSFVLKHKDEVTFRNPLTGFPVCLKVNDEEVHGYSYRVHGRSVTARIIKKLPTTNKRKTTSTSVPSIIHSIDAAILSMIKGGLLDCDMSFIHDSIGVHPNSLNKAKESVYDALNRVINAEVYHDLLEQLIEGIAEDIPSELINPPFEGTWDTDCMSLEECYYAFS